ncbi:hypothetical protein BT96DRAFT_947299 [Gymnopus androsaceus JB14]|uniref:Uncharacterized protein n=1 Tax=Gymnopus androsaceus JB14 TaxID=1447944 RepID=A0A6A4GT46_9AGAR|nr:hypothetical protein BT96DRAFT_947299 [Gymnopus androsaceus JB14]
MNRERLGGVAGLISLRLQKKSLGLNMGWDSDSWSETCLLNQRKPVLLRKNTGLMLDLWGTSDTLGYEQVLMWLMELLGCERACPSVPGGSGGGLFIKSTKVYKRYGGETSELAQEMLDDCGL